MLGPIFALSVGKSLGLAGTNAAAHFRESSLFWVATIAVAILVALTLRETGHAVKGASS